MRWVLFAGNVRRGKDGMTYNSHIGSVLLKKSWLKSIFKFRLQQDSQKKTV